MQTWKLILYHESKDKNLSNDASKLLIILQTSIRVHKIMAQRV